MKTLNTGSRRMAPRHFFGKLADFAASRFLKRPHADPLTPDCSGGDARRKRGSESGRYRWRKKLSQPAWIE